jgi:hypothetical protein
MSYCGVSIFSDNLSGQTANVTFFPCTGGTISLGDQVFPFTYVTDYWYGTYDCYVSTYAYSYVVEVPCPSPTPTPTITQTKTPSETPTSTVTTTITSTPTPSVTSGITPTVTASQTVTPTITPTITPSPTSAAYRNFSIQNYYSGGLVITTAPTTSFDAEFQNVFPLAAGLTNAWHGTIVIGDTCSISITGGTSYNWYILRNGVILDFITGTTPSNPSYTFSTGFTENDLLRFEII